MSRGFKLIVSILCLSAMSFEEIDPLNQKVSMEFKEESLESVLIKLSEVSEAQFAFNPDILPKQSISKTYIEQSLSTILDELLSEGYQYRLRGSYIIIQPIPKEEKTSIKLQGQVLDAQTGKKLSNTTIYEVNKLSATLTDSEGAYALDSKPSADKVVLAISKENYKDTIITVDKTQNIFMQLMLEPIEKTESTFKEIKEFTNIFISEKIKNHNKNVKLDEHRWVQASLVPGISTNGSLNGQVINSISFNLLGGYSKGLTGVEFGGVFNAERGYVRGVQMAGVYNSVGDAVEGLQLSGGANVVSQGVLGMQASGAVNIARDLQGFQATGLVNITQRTHGVQMSGLLNQSTYTEGMQASGGVNISRYLFGLQVAGVFNQVNSHMKGVQFSGLYNGAMRDAKGLQVSGVYNHVADSLNGMQVSLINHAGVLKGVQIGLINHASSVDKGTMIGLINLAHDEIIALDFEYNDVTEYNASFKSGMEHFYTIYSLGLSQNKNLWSGGLGLGTQKHLHKFVYVGFEATGHTLFPIFEKITGLPINGRLNLSLGIQITPRISLHGGPVVHYLYHNDLIEGHFDPSTTIGTDPLYVNTLKDSYQKWWVGYQVGLRL